MSQYDASKQNYQEVTIMGKPALFTDFRIDRATVPEGVYRYELRHGDEDWGEPVSLSRSIVVNYYGTSSPCRSVYPFPRFLQRAIRASARKGSYRLIGAFPG